MSTCVFCQIGSGEAPAQRVSEFDEGFVIVPLRPVVEGHLLVIPFEHVNDFRESSSLSGRMMSAAAMVARRYESANVITSAGIPATQTVFHLHLHVIPRVPGDGLALPWSTGKAVES